MATLVGAAVTPGYNPFLFDDGDLNSSLSPLQTLEDMMVENAWANPAFPYDHQMVDFQSGTLEDEPADQPSLGVSASAGGSSTLPSYAARSPGGSNEPRPSSHLPANQSTARQAPGLGGIDSSAGGSSLSPGERLILTPTSTNFDPYSNEDDEPSSGISPTSTDGDFVYVHRFNSHQAGIAAARMSNRPPPSSGGSGASRASSIAPPASSNATSFAGQWGPMTTATTDGWMAHDGAGNHTHAGSFGSLTAGYGFGNNTFAPPQIDDDDLLSDLSTFDNATNSTVNANLPFRLMDGHNAGQNYYRIGSPYAHQYLQAQQRQHYHHGNVFQAQQHPATYPPAQQHPMQTAPGAHFTVPSNVPSTSIASLQQQSGAYTIPSNIKQEHMLPSQRQLDTTQTPFARQPARRQAQRPLPAAAIKQEPRHSAMNMAAASSSNRPLPAIAKRDPANAPSEAQRLTQADKNRAAGGRARHSHLGESARQKSHKMRKVTACWRCALQRDPVSNSPFP